MSEWEIRVKLFTRIGITFIVLIGCLIAIFGDYPEEHSKWAFAMIGVLIGYWLK